MKVVQINAIYGSKSTGTIVKEIQSCCETHGIDGYVAYSIADRPDRQVYHGYRIGNMVTIKWHALLSRIFGRQAYFNRLSTWKLLHWLDSLRPDVVHLHNLHSNYIHLNMLLRYLAKQDIATVITMHDCWYYTGGCTHYSSICCQRWQTGCGQCPIWKRIPSWFCDTTASVNKDRSRYLTAIPRLTMTGASKWIADEAYKSFLNVKNICFIHNGFDFSVFKPSSSRRRNELGIINRFVILGPANKWLLPINKPTLDFFIEKMTGDMVLVLFGNGSFNYSLPKQVIQLGYTSSRQEMAELYSMADVFVNCSREDTLSSLNIESQACGTPVVTYDATGSLETVDGKCGFAVPTGGVNDLWERVIEIKEKGKAFYSSRCIEWTHAGFDKVVQYENYIELYNRITR